MERRADLPLLDVPLLDVISLKKYFAIGKGVLKRRAQQVKAVDDVSFSVCQGETLGLVGESGCGKTTVGRCIVRLVVADAGQVLFNTELAGAGGGAGEEAGRTVDINRITDPDQLKLVRRRIQMIFQDPHSSLNPRMTVRTILAEPFLIHRIGGSRRDVDDRVVQLMRSVGLNPAHRNRYPHEFSGGQRQRIGIARALALEPRLLIADEPVSALDVSIQAQILNLLKSIQREFGLTFIFIAHDLSVVMHMSDRIAVMYLGKIVELLSKRELFFNPRHPYTEALLSAVPQPDVDLRPQPIILRGDVPSPIAPPAGCLFHTRCVYAQQGGRMDRCSAQVPELQGVAPDHWTACHYAGELQLSSAQQLGASTK